MKVRSLAVLMFLLLASSFLLAQSTGSIKGQVTDPTGAVVVDATVTAKSASGQVVTAATNKQGNYDIKGLPAGKYEITVLAKGFSKYNTSDLVVEAGKAQDLDISLEIAVAAEKVDVQDTNTQVAVDPSSNATAIVLKGKDLDALSDDPDDLANDLQALAGPSAGPNGGQIYIDGFTNGQLPPKSAIREVRINTNPFSAEYDHIGYGRIEIFTKPGTDKFHGQGMFNFNNKIFNARNPFNHADQPGYQSELYNANVGGPLSKKASFFFNVQRRRQDETGIVNTVALDNNFNQVPFSIAVPNPATRTSINPRIDYQLTKNNTLMARFEYNRSENTNGGYDIYSLPVYGSNALRTNEEVQLTDTQIVSTTVINETRFQFERNRSSNIAEGFTPNISVSGAFSAGGGSVSADHSEQYELHNNTRMTRGKHLISFGGRLRAERDANQSTSGYNGAFTFDSLTAYQITQKGLAQGLTAAQIRAAGGGASQFRITAGTPLVTVTQEDAGLFAEDTWTIRPNISLTTGLRFETQSNIDNHLNFAPRVGFAWGLGRVKNGPAKTVLRLGTGIFYDRFGQNLVMTAQRLNGVTQQNYIVTNPDFYPNLPAISSLTGSLSSPTTYRIAPNLHAPYVIQSAASLEHQLTKTATVAVTYLHSEGRHQLLTHNINAPLPGTYTGPGTGVRPLGGTNNVYEFASEGVFDQNQLISNANIRISTKISLNSFYMLNYASGNSSGSNSFPVNQYSLANEYGRTAFDVRHRFFIGGNISAPWGVRFNPFVTVSSGSPFNITLGRDLNGDSVFNDRPVFATTSACDGKVIVCTPWGIFDTQSTTGKTIPVNYGTGRGQFSFNLRISKTIGFGPSLNTEASRGNRVGAGGGGDHGPGDHGPGGGGPRGAPGGGMVRMGGPGGGPFGGPGGGAAKRYNLTFSVNANNLFNHVNPQVPVGNLASPQFGTSNALAGGFGGGGQAANRRIMLMAQFSF